MSEPVRPTALLARLRTSAGLARLRGSLVRPAARWAASVTLALALHALLGRFLARHDVIGAVVTARSPWPVLAALAIVLLQVFLYFLAPAWAIHLLVVAALTRPRAER